MARLGIAAEHAREHAREAMRHGHEVTIATDNVLDLVESFTGQPPDSVLVSADLLNGQVLAAADAAGVRVVAIVEGAAERRHAAGLGLREIVDADAPWPVVEGMLFGPRVGAAGDVASVGRACGLVVTVWGPSGAPGRTTIAVSLAAEFAALGLRVMLADADTHGSSVAPALGLPDETPGFGAACRLAAAEALTPAELDRIAQVYESPMGSFRVLTGLSRPARWPELTSERVAAAIVACQAVADVVVVDVAASVEAIADRNAATLAALAAADRVVSVGSADPLGLSRFLRTLPDIHDLVTGETTVLINRVRPSAIGLNPRDQVAATLARFAGVRDAVMVPDDRASFDAAILAGRTVSDTVPRSGARLAIRDLAARLAAPLARHATPRRRLLRGPRPEQPTTR